MILVIFYGFYHGKSPFFTTIFGEYVLLFSSIELKQQIQVVLDGRDLFSTPSAPGGICHGLCQIAPGASTRKPPRVWFPPTKASKPTEAEIMRNSWRTPKVYFEVGEDVGCFPARVLVEFSDDQKFTWNRVFHLGMGTEANGSSTKCQCQWVSQMLPCREYLPSHFPLNVTIFHLM